MLGIFTGQSSNKFIKKISNRNPQKEQAAQRCQKGYVFCFCIWNKNLPSYNGETFKNGFIAAYAKIINGNAMVSSHVW
jgi:NADPH-dependent glutamate synthase beta subunit-like oxidoreductase